MLKTHVKSPIHAATYFDPRGAQDLFFPVPAAPYLKTSIVANEDGGLSVFALNRHLQEPLRLSVEARGSGKLALESVETMHDKDLHAVNSKDKPTRIAPKALEPVKLSGETLTAELPPASWTVIRLKA